MRSYPLSVEAVRRNAACLRDELGRQDRERLDSLLTIIRSDGRVVLGEALVTLFPGMDSNASQTYFRQFRKRLAETATAAGISFVLEVDSRKKTPAAERWCWFTGENNAAATVESLMLEETEFVERSSQGAFEMRNDKLVIRYFVSYAHEDDKLKCDLLNRLQKLFKIDSAYHYEEWQDRHIVTGDKWKAEIEQAIEKCHFGLLLVSPSFLGSDFITQQELPAFVHGTLNEPEPDKRGVPVALEPLLLNGFSDLKGLQHTQIFFNTEQKAYSQIKGTRKDEFVRELYQQIRRVIDLRIVSPRRQMAIHRHRILEAEMRRDVECALENCRFVRTEARNSSLDKLDSSQAEDAIPQQRIDTLNFLNEWIVDSTAPSYFALLGELGMGKTTTCLAFARDLLEQRKNNPTLLLPIYMDLRLLGEKGATEPGLVQILDTVIQKKWHGGRAKIDLTAADVIRLVQEEGALAIFDGLDEVLVHLTRSAEQRFLRELLRLLPPIKTKGRQKELPEGKRRGRLLFSCRTHYFRTLRDQKNLLLGEDREPLSANDYRALVLMPFSENQILEYLRHNLPGQNPEQLIELIHSVHNLSEMAERPYTLSIIAKEIPQIEQWKKEGCTVTGVTLYRHMVQSWLERDVGKHTLTPSHKQRLMELFAAELWRSGRRDWSVDDLEQWLIDFLRGRPEIAAHYDGKDRELLKEDLRTATFLVRVGEDRFRFAHTSLLEFFLACHLHRGLQENNPDCWNMPLVSRETHDFIGQIFIDDRVASDKVLAALRNILRQGEQPEACRQGLAYSLLAFEKGYPMPSLIGVKLINSDVRGWKIHGRQDKKLNLCGSIWSGSRLEGAVLHHVELDGALFDNSSLDRTEFIDCRMTAANFRSAALAGTVFRDCDMAGCNLTDSTCHRTSWLRCILNDTKGVPTSIPAGFLALSTLTNKISIQHSKKPILTSYNGHSSEIGYCVLSPDGQYLATAGFDATLQLWDFLSGQCLAILHGHQEEHIGNCEFSSDGNLLLSSCEDGSIRIWNAVNGNCVAVLRGGQDGERHATFSPDGKSVASASMDGKVRVWDITSKQCLFTLDAHSEHAYSCVFSPDGRQLVSVGRGNTTICIWDVESGTCLRAIQNEEEAAAECCFSPNGKYLVTQWGGLSIWDATTWEQIGLLNCYKGDGDEYGGACSISFSRDGRYLAAGGYEGEIWLWETEHWELIRASVNGAGCISACTFSPDGNCLIFAGSSAVHVWAFLEDETPLTNLCQRASHISTSSTYTPDGKTYATAGHDGLLRIWDANSGECISSYSAHARGVNSCACSPNNMHIATSGFDKSVRIWDLLNKRCLVTLPTCYIYSCTYSPSGRHLAMITRDELEIYDTSNWKRIPDLCIKTGSIADCAFSPDSRFLALAGRGGFIAIYDLENKNYKLKLFSHDEKGVFACTFSPDGQWLMTAGYDRKIWIWDVSTGNSLKCLEGHEDSIGWLACIKDSHTLISAGYDGTIRSWDLVSNQSEVIVCIGTRQLSDVAVSPDGKHVIAVVNETTLSMWDITSKQEVRRNYILPDGNWATIDPINNRILKVSHDAWRWLGWSGIDPATGRMERWPAEMFGPLPE